MGLDASMAVRRLSKNGKNVISPPPKNLARKIFFYIFGGKQSCFELHSSNIS
jgi:sodium/potassium-transporting ATPase subunit alpha